MTAFWKKIKPWHCGLIIGLITFLVLVSGWSKCSETRGEFMILLLMSVATGFCVFVLCRSSMKAWLVFFLLGLALGLESALELFWEISFDRQCFVALATALFWMVLAFVMGSIAEFIRLLHRVSHKIGKSTEEKINKLMNKAKKRS